MPPPSRPVPFGDQLRSWRSSLVAPAFVEFAAAAIMFVPIKIPPVGPAIAIEIPTRAPVEIPTIAPVHSVIGLSHRWCVDRCRGICASIRIIRVIWITVRVVACVAGGLRSAETKTETHRQRPVPRQQLRHRKPRLPLSQLYLPIAWPSPFGLWGAHHKCVPIFEYIQPHMYAA